MPHQDRALASVDAILVAAEQVLLDEGFARATTNRIAARAGVNVSLVYRYFAGKEAIVGALVERASARTYEAVERALADTATAPLPEVIGALVDALVSTPGMDPGLHRELVEHVDVTPRRDAIHTLHDRVSTLFAAMLASRSQELRVFADQEAVMFVVEHATAAAAHAAAFYRPDGLTAQRARDALVEMVLRTLGRVQDGPPSPSDRS